MQQARPIRVLFDLVHPANSLLFHHSIKTLQREGAGVFLASRHKDVLTPLLDEMGFPHTPISTAGQGRAALAAELVTRDWRLWKIVRRFHPDVMVGFGGIAISHVGKLTGVPSLSLYDTEHAKLQISLTLPFITEWHVPTTWQGDIASGRTRHFKTGKQFAYLHPDHFQPSLELAMAAGFDPAVENFMIRTVSWTANHDHGRTGIPLQQLRAIVGMLSARGKVHISAEGELPPDLEPMRYKGTPLSFHHLLAHCRLHCGESVTIASEAVMLGVPVLLQNDKEHCYITEQQELGLIRRFGPNDDPHSAVEAILSEDRQSFRQRAQTFAAGSGDLNVYILDQIRRLANDYRSRRRGA
jgi:predicted glycosyltransferase